MQRYEHALITRILDTGDYRSVKNYGISSAKFFLPDTRAAWNWITTQVNQHGAPPSREVFADAFRNFSFSPTADPVSALAERVHAHYVYNEEQKFFDHCAIAAKDDPLGAAEYIAQQAAHFRTLITGAGVNTARDITKFMEDERAGYYQRKETQGMVGTPWPWSRLNYATMGKGPGSLNVFYARPGNMKTFLLLVDAMYSHYYHGRTPLVFTREMPAADLQRRCISIHAKVDYKRYMHGTLSTEEERRWMEATEAFEEAAPFLIDTVPGSGKEAAEAIVAKAQEAGATDLYVDGLHLFGERQWELMAEFTTTLKWHLINTLGIPCVATSQKNTKKSGAKDASGEDMAYGDSIVQDADVLIRVMYVKEDHKLYMKTAKLREGEDTEIAIWARPSTDFSEAYGGAVDQDDEEPDGTDIVHGG